MNEMGKKYSVLSGMGPDRTGIARSISQSVFNAGCSIDDSRMVKLGGEFAILALISGDESAVDRFSSGLGELETETGLSLSLRPTGAPPTGSAEPALAYRIHVVGMDRLGVVFRVTNLLVRHGINIGSLETESHHAPVTGTPLFRMDLVAEVPASVPVGTLREDLALLCDEMNMDFSLEAVQ
ncbi:MAG: ACT domain-containing protein [Gemmatimonadota bacterium]|nr:ACT domain-containing protein [Gemmatimonadota bacterium]